MLRLVLERPQEGFFIGALGADMRTLRPTRKKPPLPSLDDRNVR
jgi:hypothetical protein